MGSSPLSTILVAILHNFTLPTWILMGASLQSLLVLCLPRRVALLPAAFLLLLRILHTAVVSAGWISNPYLNRVRMGKWTATQLNQDGSAPETGAENEVVVFMVGATCNHPLGLFAPGFKDTGDSVNKLWAEAESDREKWGFLGKSSDLIGVQDDAGYIIMTLSYWKSLDHLHAFAHAEGHRRVWDWWNRTIKEHDHIGIMHETYSVPKGRWENIYVNLRPIAMGETTHAVPASKLASPTAEHQLLSPLIQVKGAKWRSMYNRMGHVSPE